MKKPLLSCLWLFGLVIVSSGCSQSEPAKGPDVSGSTITGRVLQNGKPLKLLKDETINVAFVGQGEGTITAIGQLKEDGSFDIQGPSGKGVPAGKYKISLTSDIYGGSTGDRFADKFDAATSPFVVDVAASGTQQFDIDLGTRKTVKK